MSIGCVAMTEQRLCFPGIRASFIRFCLNICITRIVYEYAVCVISDGEQAGCTKTDAEQICNLGASHWCSRTATANPNDASSEANPLQAPHPESKKKEKNNNKGKKQARRAVSLAFQHSCGVSCPTGASSGTMA